MAPSAARGCSAVDSSSTTGCLRWVEYGSLLDGRRGSHPDSLLAFVSSASSHVACLAMSGLSEGPQWVERTSKLVFRQGAIQAAPYRSTRLAHDLHRQLLFRGILVEQSLSATHG